jgi:hypothetical protein
METASYTVSATVPDGTPERLQARLKGRYVRPPRRGLTVNTAPLSS